MIRREFLKTSIAASIGAGFLFNTSSCKGANDKIVLAVIGVGSWGMTGVLNCCKVNEGVTIKTLCDVNRTRLDRSAALVEREFGYRPGTTGEMKEVLDDKDVDAVWVATPEHWHALATIWACQARKDVYVEKNPSINIREGRKMIEAAKKYKRIVQVGFQNRSAAYGFTAREYIASGKLGKVVAVKCYNMLGGRKWTEKPDEPVPSWLDWDKWQGPAAVRTFNPSIVSETGRGDWGCYWAYSGGGLSDDASHVMDFARLVLGDPPHPKSVFGWGGNFVFGGTRETPEFQSIVYDFDDFTMSCEGGYATNYMIKTPTDIRMDKTRFPNWANNATRTEIYGSEGFMYLGRMGGGWQVFGEDMKLLAQKTGYFPDEAHQRNFIECIRSRKTPNAIIEQGILSAAMINLANLSYRSGKKMLGIDPVTGAITGNPEAAALDKKTYRKGYELV